MEIQAYKDGYKVIIDDPMLYGYEMVFENQTYLRAYLIKEHKMDWNDASYAIRHAKEVSLVR